MNKPIHLPDGIIIPSSTDYLADVDRSLETCLGAAGIDESIITDIAISVSELVNNAIVHGNGWDRDKQVEVRFTVSPTEVTVTVTDQGRGFDPSHLPNPVADDNLLREVGRGLFIVKNFVDEVDVRMVPSGGTCVEIRKKLS